MLAETGWLADRLRDRSIRIVDARSKEQYEAGHIAGAVRMDGFGDSIPRAENGDMGSAAEFARASGRMIVDNGVRHPTLSSDTSSGRATRKQRSCGRYDASNSTWMLTISLGSAPSCETPTGKPPTMPPSVLDARSDTVNIRISDFV
jgi:rhodanese-related sulfurtransferase